MHFGKKPGKMEFYFDRQALTDELKQKQAITYTLINKILYSKRLLVDHVEALEQCLNHLQISSTTRRDVSTANETNINNAQNEIFTGRNTCVLLAATVFEHLVTPRAIRFTLIPTVLFTSGFTALYALKNIFIFRNKIVASELDSLIRTIDAFGNCIRRNMTYFNEIIVMKQQELIESRQIERAWDCITAAKEVTEMLYDATRKLETQYPLPAKYKQYYSPMEELRECEYFKNNVTDYSPQHLKDFHNIFAYVQSQFLLCLALIISTKPSISELNVELVKIDCLIRQLVLEEENHFKNLAIELNKKKQVEMESLNAAKTMQNRSGPVAVLQNTSLKLSACMVAVAGECQTLDTTLQRLTEAEAAHKDSAKQLIEVSNNMRSIENALSICFDDFQRLMLVYSKFLSNKLNDEKKKDKNNEKDNKLHNDNNEFTESFLRVEISQSASDLESKDDFYAYMFDEQQPNKSEIEDTNKTAQEMDILNFEKRVTRVKFRPVLKQLKNRIDPIRQVMLDKEREVLAAKGINVDELFAKENNNQNAELQNESKLSDKYIDSISATNQSDNVDDGNDANENNGNTDSEGSADLEYKRCSKNLKERDNFAEMRNFLAQKQAINIMKMEMPAPVKTTGNEILLESDC